MQICYIYSIWLRDVFYTLHRIVSGSIQYAFELNLYHYKFMFCSLLAGLIWNKIATEFDNWEVELTFKIAGRGRVGADGLVSFGNA